MRDATDGRSLTARVAEIVRGRRAEILHAYARSIAGSAPVDASADHTRLVEQAGTVLDDLDRRFASRAQRASPPPAPRQAGAGADPPRADTAATRASEPATDGSVVLFRRALEAVLEELPPHADLPGVLVEVASAAHESIAHRLIPTAGGYAGYLLDRLHRSHVDERRRVARELHDLVAHSVAVALQDLELFTLHRDRDSERAEAKLAAALDNLRDTLDMLRAIAQDLRWSAAENGLGAALRAYVQSGSFDLPTDLRVTGDETTVPPAVQGELFLVLREALRNAHVHAGAGAVEVSVDIGADRVHAVVHDDGSGFEPRAGDDTQTGTGLASMQERVALLGGVIEVRSAPGKGTFVTVDVPLVRAWDDAED